MEDPIHEVGPLIHSLTTTTSPSTQRKTLERYFTSNASFDHPLCAVDSSLSPIESRRLLLAVYRWYKILSPIISLDVNSVAFDDCKGRLYVDATQIFTFWFLPWIRVRAELVTVLTLEKRHERRGAGGRIGGIVNGDGTGLVNGVVNGDGDSGIDRWYITQQKDLYQTEQWLGFLPFIGLWLRTLWKVQKRIATLLCLLGALFFTWIGIMRNHDDDVAVTDDDGGGAWSEKARDQAQERVLSLERKVMERAGRRWG